MTETTLIAILLTSSLVAGAPDSGRNVVPPPALEVTAPPRLVAIPDSPVLHGRNATYTLLAYGGRYYSFHNGAWFFATGPGGSWHALAGTRVPLPVRAVATVSHKPE